MISYLLWDLLLRHLHPLFALIGLMYAGVRDGHQLLASERTTTYWEELRIHAGEGQTLEHLVEELVGLLELGSLTPLGALPFLGEPALQAFEAEYIVAPPYMESILRALLRDPGQVGADHADDLLLVLLLGRK
jgi:hypothetical protein